MSNLPGGVKAHRLPTGAYAITVDGDYIGDVWPGESWYWNATRRIDYKSWNSAAGTGSLTRREAIKDLMRSVGVR